MGQRRPDWTSPISNATRHVWVRLDNILKRLRCGWSLSGVDRHSYRWWASPMTASIDEHGRPRAEVRRIEVERLTPERSDPNTGGRVLHIG